MINGLIKLTGWVFRVMAYQWRLGVVSAVACGWGGWVWGSGGLVGWLGCAWHGGECLPASLSSGGGGGGRGLLNWCCGSYGSFLAWGWPLFGPRRACGMCPKSRARRARLPRLILLVSFSDTLLVVSILDIVYDCHLWPLLQSWRG